jgi:hypothetical protein
MVEDYREFDPSEAGQDRWDDIPAPEAEPATAPLKITATPFTWRDPSTFPRRRWLYGHHLIRRFTSCTVAPGGLGKTSLVLVEAVAMATGRPLLGIQSPEGPLTVWVINLEDPQEELERRVTAILMHYRIAPEEIAGRLFLDTGRRFKLVMAETTRDGTMIVRPVVEALTEEIRARKVDVVILDPFVKSHRVSENDNGAIDLVATAFADIADATACAFDIVHHVRKTGGQEITVEDGRGAVALLGAVRSARVLNAMTKEEADRAGEGVNHRSYFRAANGKLNMAPPPADKAEWFHLLSVPLGNGDPQNPVDNGDYVQCVARWHFPDALADVTVDHLREVQTAIAAGRWRESAQAKAWAGYAVGRVMGVDMGTKAGKAKVGRLLKIWIASGALMVVEGEDDARVKRSFVIVGTPALP